MVPTTALHVRQARMGAVRTNRGDKHEGET